MSSRYPRSKKYSSSSFCEESPTCMDFSERVQKAKKIHDVLVCMGVALPRCFIPVSLRKETVS